ncbi:3-oxoacyl-[acyl-carrier-protein] reductase (NADPH) [Martiniozyma asiatica (nom. inval.)]|nr:3-oxoacyl-[acyl-carrier-protein] reductase (NADPH) [Martiniozyma asiatica]
MASLLNQHALITGGSRGIGGAIASKLAALGCTVTIMSRMEKDLQLKVTQLKRESKNQNHNYIVYDLSKTETLESEIRKDQNFPKINILINCAGQTQKRLAITTPQQEIESILNVNLISPILLSKIFAKQFSKSLISNAQIVNISSELAKPGNDLVGASTYGASKAAIWKFSSTLQKELKRSKRSASIKVHSVLPGHVTDTAIGNTVSKAELDVAGEISIPTSSVAQVAQKVADILCQ